MGFVRHRYLKGQTIYVNTCPNMSQSLRNSVLYGLIMGQLSLFREQMAPVLSWCHRPMHYKLNHLARCFSALRREYSPFIMQV